MYVLRPTVFIKSAHFLCMETFTLKKTWAMSFGVLVVAPTPPPNTQHILSW